MRRQGRIYNELLVLRCQEGDTSAFEELVDRWQQRLWAHACRLTGDEDAAWDVLQDSWLAIIKGIGQLRDAAAFPVWAYRIVSHKYADLISKRQRQRDLAQSYTEDRRRVQSELANSRERSDSIEQAMSRLSCRDRVILSLYYREDFSVAEIAEILDIPPGTVKSRLHHARKRISGMMEEHLNG